MSGLVSVCTGTGLDALLPLSTSSSRTRLGKIISRSCSIVSELIGRNRNEDSTLIDTQHLVFDQISIIGRNLETREDIQGFCRPAGAALDGAGQGAWFSGLFGLMLGAIGGAGVGAPVNGLVASGIPREQALVYQDRLQAGEFLVTALYRLRPRCRD